MLKKLQNRFTKRFTKTYVHRYGGTLFSSTFDNIIILSESAKDFFIGLIYQNDSILFLDETLEITVGKTTRTLRYTDIHRWIYNYEETVFKLFTKGNTYNIHCEDTKILYDILLTLSNKIKRILLRESDYTEQEINSMLNLPAT